ncbi:MAG: hypothetical protein KBT28_07745, partial [Bacteroidales bacterium]|nr:hypothetical protein [Candidatus Colimorpha merdihippi]
QIVTKLQTKTSLSLSNLKKYQPFLREKEKKRQKKLELLKKFRILRGAKNEGKLFIGYFSVFCAKERVRNTRQKRNAL